MNISYFQFTQVRTLKRVILFFVAITDMKRDFNEKCKLYIESLGTRSQTASILSQRSKALRSMVWLRSRTTDAQTF